MVYLAYGVALDSDLRLDLPLDDRPDRPGGPGDHAEEPGEALTDTTVVLRRIDGGLADGDRIIWADDGDDGPWRMGRDGPHFVLGYDPGGCDDRMHFVISGDGVRVWWNAPDPESPTLTHLVLDHVLPQAMMRQGHLVLHASFLVDPAGRGLAIAGQSGQGKSTLAAALIGRGHRFLSDDCAVIDPGARPPTVAGAYPGLRLYQASLGVTAPSGARPAGPVSEKSDKLRVALDGGVDWAGRRRFPLHQLVVLAPEPLDGGSIRPVGPAEAVFRLLHHSFHLADPSERAEVFTRLASVVDACPVHEFHYEHTGAGLTRALDQLEALLEWRQPASDDPDHRDGWGASGD